jgi:glycerophosphoryl diester phosphodiesterase
VIDALRAAGLAERALVSTMEVGSLREIRRIAPEMRLGWSVPKVRRNYLSHPLTRMPTLVAARFGRAVMPRRAAQAIAAGEIDALMAHWALVTPALVAAVRDAGGELYVWTVDDAARIAALERLGVTGVITNDPRLFATA